jgi:hypothetical protein
VRDSVVACACISGGDHELHSAGNTKGGGYLRASVAGRRRRRGLRAVVRLQGVGRRKDAGAWATARPGPTWTFGFD